MNNDNDNNSWDKSALKALNIGIEEILEKKFGGYGSPLDKIIERVMHANGDAIFSKLNKALSDTISSESFDNVLREEFSRKVAKTLLSSLEGSVEKAANAFKADPTLKAKMIVAINTIIDSNTLAKGGK